MKIDPVPLIKGELQVARETNPDNSAKDGTLEAKNSSASLTPENVEAKQNGCAPFGPDYPKDPTETADPVPSAPITDPFERAWYFTMTHEVGPHWTPNSPSDPEVSAGLISTPAQRKKTGYVNTPSDPGGETKFGIAQASNPQLKVNTLAYEPAKLTGFNNYWKRGSTGPASMAETKPKTAIMLFDMCYLHGAGNAAVIRAGANISNMSDEASIEALAAAQQDFMRMIVIMKPQRAEYINGWLKRSRALLIYVKSL